MAADPVSYDAITKNFNSATYELLEKIGEGGFGSVYKAKQLTTGQIVAIKFLAISPDFDEAKKKRYIERFERETLLCSRLQHPNIVRLLDKGQGDNDLLYAVFEYVDGKTLKELLIDNGSLPAVETADIMGQVLEALAYAHEQGITHRDIKPANIMLIQTSVRTHVKVLDFGIGTFVNEARQQDYKSITLTQEALGTPSYSAPEQLRGEPPTVKTDVYVWALVFLECLTGSPTVSGANLASVFHKQLSQSNVPLPAPIVGHPVASLLRRALQKKVHERTITSHELFAELKLLNFSNLVGDLSGQSAGGMADTTTCVSSVDQATMENPSAAALTGLTERKQITALAVCIQVRKVADEVLDAEVIEALHHDQKNQCTDIAVRYGATHVGTLGDTLLFYFGYPAVSDNDARLCARTALDIMSGLAKRNHLLKQNQGIIMQGRLGVHTGLVTTYADAIPEGDTPNTALELARAADADQILCSDVTRKLLEAYIQFDAASIIEAGVNALQTPTFRLTGERLVEAFGFLRGTRKNNAFVGRETELKTLTGILQKSQRPQDHIPGLVHINGEAGIGKSRLVFELRDQAKGYYHYVAQCLPEHQNNALYPILNLLKFKFSLDALDSIQTADLLIELAQQLDNEYSEVLTPALPILFAWLNISLPDGMEPSAFAPDVQKQYLFNALSALLTHNEGHSNKKLYIFEDMHWADPTSIEFIAQFAKVIQASNDIFISTSRQPLPESLEGKNFESVGVSRLTESASKDFISTMFNGEAVAKGVLDLLISRTDGIPLFIEELVNMMQQKELVHKLNGIIDFVSPDKLDEVPTSLRDSLQQKLDSLVYAKETAQLAATIGREFDYDLLVAVSNHIESQVQNDLNELIEAELIYQQRKVDGDSYIFKHALVRDSAYESAPKKVIQKFNLKVAVVLENGPLASVEKEPFRVAQHYSLAECWEKASELGILALAESAGNSANLETITIFDRLTKWLENLPETKKVKEEQQAIDIAYPSYMAVYGLGSSQLLELRSRRSEIEESTSDLSDVEEVHSEYLQKWAEYQQLHFGGKIKEALDLGNSILHEAINRKNRLEQLLLLPLLAQTYHFLGRLDESLECFERALQLYNDDTDLELWQKYGVEPKSQSLFLMSHVLSFCGRSEQAVKSCIQAEEWARKSGCSMSIDGCIAYHAMSLFHQQDRHGVLKVTQSVSTSIKGVREPQWLEGYFISLYDWALGISDFSKDFIIGLWKSEGIAGISFWMPTLCEVLVDKDPMFVIEQSKDTIKKCKEMGQLAAVPLMERNLAVALAESSGKVPDEVSVSHFREGYALAMEQKAYGIALDVATHWLECSEGTPFEGEAKESLKLVINELIEGFDTPLYLRSSSLLLA